MGFGCDALRRARLLRGWGTGALGPAFGIGALLCRPRAAHSHRICPLILLRFYFFSAAALAKCIQEKDEKEEPTIHTASTPHFFLLSESGRPAR